MNKTKSNSNTLSGEELIDNRKGGFRNNNDENKKGYLVMYKLKTENNNDISKEEKRKLNNLRHKIIDNLKHKYNALPIGSGQWYINSNKNKKELTEQVEEWGGEYEKYDNSYITVFTVRQFNDQNFLERGAENLSRKLKDVKQKLLKLEKNPEKINENKVKNLERKYEMIEDTLESFENLFKKIKGGDFIKEFNEELLNSEMLIFKLYDHL
ncbi:MAG: hypothetical protein ACOCP8_00965 [archaeon]